MRPTVWTLATILTAILAATLSPLSAQQDNSPNTLRLVEGAPSPPAKIAQLAFLAGYWRGPGLGGDSEELWGQPHADRMYGSYALFKEDGAVFSEAMLLVEEGDSVVLRVKHFTPDFVGWEEKDGFVTFPLVRLGENEAYFNGLTFRRVGDTLSIYLVLSKAGERTEHEFTLQRVPL